MASKKSYVPKICNICKEEIKTQDEMIMHKLKPYHMTPCYQQKLQNEADEIDWLELCDYIHTKILGYDNTIKFNKSLALRLKGLRHGKFMGNNKVRAEADYPYKIMYYTFVLKSLDIKNAFATIKFKDEGHKINYMMQVIENHVVDMLLHMRKKEKNQERIENTEIDAPMTQVTQADYKKKSGEIKQDLEKYW